MIGRGMVTDPSLAQAIQAMDVTKATHASAAALSLDWYSLFPLIQDFWDLVGRRLDKKSRTGRLKQWLNFLRRSYPEAESAYQALRIYNEPERVDAWLASEQLSRVGPEAPDRQAVKSASNPSTGSNRLLR